MTEDRLLFPIWALRFFLERSMPWREHKHLLFVSFKPGHKRDIVPATISWWIRKQFWKATQITLHLLESHKVKAHQVRSMAVSLAFHRQARHSTDRFCELLPGTVVTPSPTFKLGPVVAAESILHPTLEIIRGNIVYIPPSIHLDYAPCEATEPG